MVSVGLSMPKERVWLHRKVLSVSLLSNLTILFPLPHNKHEHILLALSLCLEVGDLSGPIHPAYS